MNDAERLQEGKWRVSNSDTGSGDVFGIYRREVTLAAFVLGDVLRAVTQFSIHIISAIKTRSQVREIYRMRSLGNWLSD